MVAVVIVIFGTIYTVVQQAQRNDANYPQIQLAEDTAAQIKSGSDPYIASLNPPVDMRTSLAPFTIVYDKAGHPLSGSGYLNSKVPNAPSGILTAALGKTYNAVTWQPQKDVRIAAVTVTAKGYYVLSGRSLTEVEKNETHTLQLTAIGGIIALVLLGIGAVGKMLITEY